ncbi:MAG: aconitate hydratase AcnA [Anaerolineaceae bacterium]|nr:aconitate hydratase AcnA [Anaerolineaceae bacterium]
MLNFNPVANLEINGQEHSYYRLRSLEDAGLCHLESFPYCIRLLLENVLRNHVSGSATADDVLRIASWSPEIVSEAEIPFTPARVLLQDYTGVPAVVDLAAMRSALDRLGGDPARINPKIPVDLVIDHSVQVDVFGEEDAIRINSQWEFERNRERYEFLHWGQKAFSNFKVVPPATGIVHQVNLEYLARVVQIHSDEAGRSVLLPDTLVGADSHTTMINALGVLGWGVGGIEAEAAMLGQPIYILLPEVVGCKLVGTLPEGATATDLVLRVTQLLRQHKVVGKFVEFYGAGLSQLSLPDRATLANMAPEYGATVGFFPVDRETIDYLARTGRTEGQLRVVERYCREQRLFRENHAADPLYHQSLELDLSTIQPSLAGPLRPQDRIPMHEMKSRFQEALAAPVASQGFQIAEDERDRFVDYAYNGSSIDICHGSVVIAAITSCTNTSNPSVMVAAGLLARNAVERGLRSAPQVKTSLAPGSKVVSAYLERAELLEPLQELGFHVVGYGCTTCIGNSGPLPSQLSELIAEHGLITAAVLSGNRNFGGRISPDVRANYLASPPLVVAYALAGRVDFDFNSDALGWDAAGHEIYLRDIWPSQAEIESTIRQSVDSALFLQQYTDVYDGNVSWNDIPSTDSLVYEWQEESSYIQEPPFFADFPLQPVAPREISGARVLALLGNSVTTDHISPAGSIHSRTEAGQFLLSKGIDRAQFNSFGARRGNDRIMTRGTFANLRLRNSLVPGTEGGFTEHFPSGEMVSIFEASCRYRATNTPLIILAGEDYGMGSSRDWAAKGPLLLGVKATLAVSYERIHRSNLVFMGILPLQFLPGDDVSSLGLTGRESFHIQDLPEKITPNQSLPIMALTEGGKHIEFEALARIETPIEAVYYRHGGILPYMLRSFLND